jgi:hypothetical protein
MSNTLSMHQLLFRTEDFTYPMLSAWCKALVRAQEAEPSPVWVVESLTHYKFPWTRFQHEFLVLQAAELDGTDDRRVYIAIGRMMQRPGQLPPSDVSPPQGSLALLGIRGFAVEEVTILASPLSLPLGLRSIVWGVNPCAPRLTDVSTILFVVSCIEPYYSPLSTQCYWFSQAGYRALKDIYRDRGATEKESDKSWKLSHLAKFPVTLTDTHDPERNLKGRIRFYRNTLGWRSGG